MPAAESLVAAAWTELCCHGKKKKRGDQMPGTNAIVVTAAIIEKAGAVLIVRKGPGKRHAGRWEFPGGKVEAGEGPEECLQREIMEELRIRVRVRGFVCESRYRYPHAAIRLLAYRVDWLSGEIRLSDHDAVGWVRPRDLTGWDLLPADLPIAEALAAGDG
jgi:8-oxo-dGTP diphosphatase